MLALVIIGLVVFFLASGESSPAAGKSINTIPTGNIPTGAGQDPVIIPPVVSDYRQELTEQSIYFAPLTPRPPLPTVWERIAAALKAMPVPNSGTQAEQTSASTLGVSDTVYNKYEMQSDERIQ